VAKVLADPEGAELSPKVRAALRLLRTVTRDHASVTADDVRPLLAAGVSRQGVLDALMIGWAFNVITRLADTFEFHVPDQKGFAVGAKMLLTRGYR
jgi:alkylhydroperoxidase family enzyme